MTSGSYVLAGKWCFVFIWFFSYDEISKSLKVHSGSVWKINWAHPEFGQILGTCSFDRTAIIWEEISRNHFFQHVYKLRYVLHGSVSETSNASGHKSQKHWIKRCSLVDSRSNVTDIKFAPKHLGLIVVRFKGLDSCFPPFENLLFQATCSQDGVFRIYEASDIMNLTQWSLQHEIEASKLRCSCIAWNPSP